MRRGILPVDESAACADRSWNGGCRAGRRVGPTTGAAASRATGGAREGCC